MANDQNLNNRAATQFRAGEEQVRIAKKGGIASGQARRRKKTLSELAKMIAENPAPTAAKKELAKMGIADEDANNMAVVATSLYKKAADGNIQAIEKWEQLTAASKDDD